ncbi:chalcone isomerase family protein [Rhodocyclaceae bacterium SMB388]
MALTFVALWSAAHAAQDAPALPHPLGEQQWQAIGSGELRWFGFRVYRAALWAADPLRWDTHDDFALVIRYARAIDASRLVQASLDEMRRLGQASEAQLSGWGPRLQAAFPDVAAGDRITGVNLAGRGVAFYFGNELTVEILDPAFARAFFAIWLDERTREPGLRARLLGASTDG